MSDMKLRLLDHTRYNVEYVEEDTLTIIVALASCFITILLDLLWPPSQTETGLQQSSNLKSPVSSMSTTRDSTISSNTIPEQAQLVTGSNNTTISQSSTAKNQQQFTSTLSGKSTSHLQKVAVGTNGVSPSTTTTTTKTTRLKKSQPSVSTTRSNASENALPSPNTMTLLINQESTPQQTTSPST